MSRSGMPHLERLPKRRRDFLKAYAETLNITEAARRVDRDPDTHDYWLQTDPDYVECFEAVKVIAVQSLEDEAVRRAKEGYVVPVVSGGKIVTYARKYSDALLIKLLQRFNPKAHKDRSTRSGKEDRGTLGDVAECDTERFGSSVHPASGWIEGHK
jgi:hypothetical protein